VALPVQRVGGEAGSQPDVDGKGIPNRRIRRQERKKREDMVGGYAPR